MNNKEKKIYLKQALDLLICLKENDCVADEHFIKFPKLLYKYGMFKDYTVEMIKENYIYLCPAEELDDQFECSVNYGFSDNFMKTKAFKNALYEYFAGYIEELHCDEPKTVKKVVKVFIDNNMNITYADILKKCPQITEDEFKLVELFLSNISSMLLKYEQNTQCLKANILNIYNSKTQVGIGSLSETNKSQVMWEMYSNGYKGFCIEYDFRDDWRCLMNTFPVVYENKKRTNFLFILSKITMNKILKSSLQSVLNGENGFELMELYVTKYKEWSFQKEWRIIGEPRNKFKVPKIIAIYLGKNCSFENKEVILKLANEIGFHVYQQCDNTVCLSMDFKKIL